MSKTAVPRPRPGPTTAIPPSLIYKLQNLCSADPECFPEASPEAPLRYALLVTTKSLRQSRESGEPFRKAVPKGSTPGTEARHYIRINTFPFRHFRLPHHVAQRTQQAPQQRPAPNKD